MFRGTEIGWPPHVCLPSLFGVFAALWCYVSAAVAHHCGLGKAWKKERIFHLPVPEDEARLDEARRRQTNLWAISTDSGSKSDKVTVYQILFACSTATGLQGVHGFATLARWRGWVSQTDNCFYQA